ncbi:unnamed protein product [Fraxinus pennsylvanica]|uniref:Uncharacterized protein n=1 Tax=Fraxinus pennsylvanica TaxID=56036 RepID=A0AAD2DU70_9LAMI|nr:unnamed protein product [Fraxinus pennsylvanica]
MMVKKPIKKMVTKGWSWILSQGQWKMYRVDHVTHLAVKIIWIDRPKGPRIAKVVRRINCNVESPDFGVINAGKLWCDSQTIYPKGFRSRVRYIDVLDPSNMSNYVSEILDAGRDEPLFMVSLEYCPSEVFVHVSAVKCWEMVRYRVNQEIAKQRKVEKMKLPPLQPPGSLDGLEMFGFSSPAIVQLTVELILFFALHLCTLWLK